MTVKRRLCLRCGKDFRSLSPANRICSRCARANAKIHIGEKQLQKQRGDKRLNGESLVANPQDEE